MDKYKLAANLIEWYLEHGRDLPWRHTANPYYIWISEIMLQQTQVATVIPYYEKFISTYPTVDDLADAVTDELFKVWEGLGYYRRAKHLKEAAITIRDKYQGTFPVSFDEIIQLKGIGPYTASAISSIAFEIPKGVIDGNTLRIISRLYNRQDNIALDKTRKAYQSIIDQLILKENASAFNQGMMDLGATICTPKNPECARCPIRTSCLAYLNDCVDILPVNIKKIKRTETNYITAVLRHGDEYFLIKNKEGLLENLYGLVQYEVESPLSYEESFYEEYKIAVHLDYSIKEVKHVFTHKTWHMHLYEGQLLGPPRNENHLYTLDELHRLPISTAHKKALDSFFEFLGKAFT